MRKRNRQGFQSIPTFIYIIIVIPLIILFPGESQRGTENGASFRESKRLLKDVCDERMDICLRKRYTACWIFSWHNFNLWCIFWTKSTTTLKGYSFCVPFSRSAIRKGEKGESCVPEVALVLPSDFSVRFMATNDYKRKRGYNAVVEQEWLWSWSVFGTNKREGEETTEYYSLNFGNKARRKVDVKVEKKRCPLSGIIDF